MANRDGLNCSRVCGGKRFLYSVREDGRVFRTSRKTLKEATVKPYLSKGHAAVKINGREYRLKNLVAQHFIEGYRPGDYVETLGGDPFRCAVWNLRLYSQMEHGQKTGWLCSQSRRIIANGVEYRSIRACAAALHVSYQTIHDYLAGRVRRSVLRGIEISLAAQAGGAAEEVR